MNVLRVSFLLGLATFASTQAAVINLDNKGFESGLDGWTTLGDVSAIGASTVVTFNSITWNVSPFGDQMAAMNSTGAIATGELDAFFGLPGNTLQNLNMPGSFPSGAGGALTNGSGIYQDFQGFAGDTVTVYINYVARDYIPFNDPGFSLLVDPSGEFQVQTIASIYGGGLEVGTAGNSGWRAVTYTLNESGTHRLGFAVTNDRDTVLNAALFIDDNPGENEGNLQPGTTPLFPILPPDNAGTPDDPWVFVNPQPNLWYDPPFADAFTYELDGSAFFTSFTTPPSGFGFGDLLFTDLTGANASFTAQAGVLYNLANPTHKFKISGLADGLLDSTLPNFGTAFPILLDWDGDADALTISFTNHPQSAVPEPATFAMLGLGLTGVLAFRQRLRR